MFESSEDKLNHDFDESMRMFEKALIDVGDPIEPTRPTKVLVALDGSDQDSAAMEAAAELRERFQTHLLLLDGREEKGEGPSITEQYAGSSVTCLEPLEGPSYDQILAATKSQQPDMVILPCPFGREFESIGADSAGTVIDVMLTRCPVPMLIIRRPDQRIGDVLRTVSFIVAAECEAESAAADCAFGLVREGGSITLDVVVDKEQLENLKSLLAVIAPEQQIDVQDLNKAIADSHASLHARMQQAASDIGLSYQIVPMANESAPPVLGEEAKPLLIVLPLEVDDRFVHGFVHDRIRRSPHPVLVVPTHVDTSTS